MNPNEQAERLVNAYADAILRLSYSYLKNTDDAQDICQTVFVKLLSEPREFESAEHERAYILRMASNACKDLLKSPGGNGPAVWKRFWRFPRRRRRTGRSWRRSTRFRRTTGR